MSAGDTPTLKARAERILARATELGALRTGDFTLTSGQKSSYYFDGRLLTHVGQLRPQPLPPLEAGR